MREHRRMISIGEAILREIDDNEHAAYIADVQQYVGAFYGGALTLNVVKDVKAGLVRLHSEHCGLAARRLRKISLNTIDMETGVFALVIEPFVPPAYLTRQP
jgi:hypothetical protein